MKALAQIAKLLALAAAVALGVSVIFAALDELHSALEALTHCVVLGMPAAVLHVLSKPTSYVTR